MLSMEKETNNLQKEAKTYLDAMRGMLFIGTQGGELTGSDGFCPDSDCRDCRSILHCRQDQ